MAKVTVSVEVSKETYELGQGIAEMIKATKEALADGFQAGQDLPVLMAAAVAHLTTAVAGVDQIDEEWAADAGAVLKAVSLGVAEAYGAAKG